MRNEYTFFIILYSYKHNNLQLNEKTPSYSCVNASNARRCYVSTSHLCWVPVCACCKCVHTKCSVLTVYQLLRPRSRVVEVVGCKACHPSLCSNTLTADSKYFIEVLVLHRNWRVALSSDCTKYFDCIFPFLSVPPTWLIKRLTGRKPGKIGKDGKEWQKKWQMWQMWQMLQMWQKWQR